LDSEEDLFDGDGGLPGLFLVEDREADGAGRVDVGVEERRSEFAWMFCQLCRLGDLVGLSRCVHLGGLVGYSANICQRSCSLSRFQQLSQAYHPGTALRA
jgi:hypothetical protein